jgi:isocitrate dehydrogenase (NAD+)
MVTEGRAQYADPCSMIKAVAMMMEHIGEAEKGKKLNMALDVCCQFEKKLVMTGRSTGATGDEFAQYVMDTMQRSDLESVWQGYVDAAIAANKA